MEIYKREVHFSGSNARARRFSLPFMGTEEAAKLASTFVSSQFFSEQLADNVAANILAARYCLPR